MPGVSPDVNVGAVDYGPQAAGGAAIARGMDSLGRAGTVLAARIDEQQNEIDDFETAKKLTDFKLATEMELEERKRSMPVGGAGYTSSWAETYRERASGFVGEKDANIPERLRGRVGLQLKQWEAALVERAQRDEFAERDRHTIAGLETTVNQHVSRVMADPTRHDMVQGDLDKLITLAPITPAQRDVFRRKVREETSYAAAMAYAERATTAQGREEARRILAPNAPDRRAAGLPTNYLDEIKKSEGYTETAKWDYKQHSVGYGTRARFPGERITKEEAERRFGEEIGKAEAIVDGFAPNLPAGTRAALVSLTYNAGDAWTRSGLGQAVQSGNTAAIKERFMQYTRAGGEVLPGLVARRTKEAAWIGTGAAPGAAAGSFRAAQEQGEPDAYTGTLNLPLARRRQAAAHAETVYARAVEQTSKLVSSTIADATKGILPPQPVMEQLTQRVAAIGDPVLSAEYDSLVRRSAITEVLRAQPPAVLTMTAQAERARIQANGGTREEVEAVEHREKLAAESSREYNDNPIGWAQKRRPVLPMRDDTPPEALALIRDGRTDEALQRFPDHLRRAEFQPLNFAAPDIGQQLDDRAAVSQAVARYGGGAPRLFAPNEAQIMQNVLAKGGEPMLVMMGHIAQAAERNGINASQVMAEIAPKDGPELSMVGHLVANGGDRRTLQSAAQALAWKHGQGERFESSIAKTRANPSLGDYDKVFATAPTARDSLKAMANLVYEYESRQKGIGTATFDQTLYTDIVQRIMGQTKGPDGRAYGGVGYQGNSWWFDGKYASQVLVPPQVRQDSFDSMLGALRADDLPKIGGIPLDGRGRPWSMSEIRQMTWVSVGPPGAPPIPGLYLLRSGGTDDNPELAYRQTVGRSLAAPGSARAAQDMSLEPIILDLRPVMGDLQKRKPEVFLGYDGITSGVSVADAPYASNVTLPGAASLPPTETERMMQQEGATRTGSQRRSSMPLGAVQ